MEKPTVFIGIIVKYPDNITPLMEKLSRKTGHENRGGITMFRSISIEGRIN